MSGSSSNHYSARTSLLPRGCGWLALHSLLLLLFASTLLRADSSFAQGILGAGTRWETPFHIIESKSPGPTVLITAGLHGNEPAGAHAADQIRRWRITKGKLVVIPRVNVPGLKKGTRYLPEVEKALRDLNRNFPRTGKANEARGELAKMIWEFAQKHKPTWVLDLHEGFHFHQINEDSVGSTIIDANTKPADAVIPSMLAAVNKTIPDQRKKFIRLRSAVNGSLSRAARDRLGAASMTLETTFREQPLALRARQHRIMVHALLSQLGMIEADEPNLIAPSAEKNR